jgi:lipid A 3-O-deacylase PagL
MKPVLSLVILAVGVTSGVTAQSRSWEIGARAGGGPSIVTASLGGVPDGQLLITSVSVTRSFMHWKRFSASYFGEVMPLLVATRVPKVRPEWFYIRGHTDSILGQYPSGEGPDVGVGLAPVGLRLSFQLGPGISVFGEGNGGGVAFARAFPITGARSLNFLGSAGAGLRLGTHSHRSYLVGYRFTHISNANTAFVNPGFNAHVFYLGITLH